MTAVWGGLRYIRCQATNQRFLWLQAEGALDKAWDATDVAKKTRVKLGGGFYCGQIAVDGVK